MLSFAVVGCGRIGGLYCDLLSRLGHKISLCVGSTSSRKHIDLASRFNAAYSSDLNSLKNFNLDGIICALPPSFYLPSLLPYAHIPLLIEKPGAISPSQFDPFIEHNTPSFVAYNRLFYDNIRYLKEFVASQYALHVYARIPESLSLLPDINKYPYNYITNSCHVFSIIHYLFESPSFTTTILKSSQSIFSSTHTSFSDNYHITVHVVYNEYSNTSISFKGNSDTLVLSPLEKLTSFTSLAVTTEQVNSSLIRKYNPISQVISEEDLSIKPGFLPLIKSFANFISSGIVDPRLISFSAARSILTSMRY